MWIKHLFDYLMALIILPVALPIIIILIIISTIETGQFGLFTHKRVGKSARLFNIYKIRTMKGSNESDITTFKTHKITKVGSFLRNNKLDEFPQLFNILLGQMSFVGPRPDVSGYADKLEGEDRIILSVKPGITGPTQLAYKNEETILSLQKDPVLYNDEIIWPDKIRMNKKYVENWSFYKDLIYVLKTVF